MKSKLAAKDWRRFPPFYILIIIFLFTQTSTAQSPKAPDAKTGDRKILGPISLQPPKGWVEKAPTNTMRKAQYDLPRAKGDNEDGELAIFYFGKGQGGDVERNIDRWVKQFVQPDGSPSRAKAKIEKRQVSGFPVTTVDVKGNYQVSATPIMSTGSTTKPGFRMLAAIAETSEGSYFIKLTGPEKTIAHWAASFNQYINSIQKR